MFGREVRFDYSESWIGYSLFLLRVVMGWVLFQGGITKVLDPEWTAAGFLLNAIPEGNPLMGLWSTLGTDYVGIIDPLNAWGLTLTGLALLVGAFVRWSAFWGAVMMLFYWLAALQGGLLQGLPIAHGEGRFEIDDERYEALESEDRVLFRYCDADGNVTDDANPNGSKGNVAGVLGERDTVAVLMPHPERATLPGLGSTDGQGV
ncbi:phosphoribosylformylglycinamidine synthase subunit PurQ, partial [Halobium palmae]